MTQEKGYPLCHHFSVGGPKHHQHREEEHPVGEHIVLIAGALHKDEVKADLPCKCDDPGEPGERSASEFERASDEDGASDAVREEEVLPGFSDDVRAALDEALDGLRGAESLFYGFWFCYSVLLKDFLMTFGRGLGH